MSCHGAPCPLGSAWGESALCDLFSLPNGSRWIRRPYGAVESIAASTPCLHHRLVSAPSGSSRGPRSYRDGHWLQLDRLVYLGGHRDCGHHLQDVLGQFTRCQVGFVARPCRVISIIVRGSEAKLNVEDVLADRDAQLTSTAPTSTGPPGATANTTTAGSATGSASPTCSPLTEPTTAACARSRRTGPCAAPRTSPGSRDDQAP